MSKDNMIEIKQFEEEETRFSEKTTPYLRELIKKSVAIRDMYEFNPEYETLPANLDVDLLNEKTSTPVFGTVRKYDGQLLVLLSYTCAANCRYCERQDRVGVGLDVEGRLKMSQIDDIVEYITNDPTIYEVIASGGDPLTNPKGLQYLFNKLKEIEHVKVVRIHTRYPLQNPGKVRMELMEELAKTKPTVYLSLHIDHPDELQPEVIELIHAFRKMGYVMLTQTVFLKTINDNKETLKTLFLHLFELGVRPYYIYHGQEVTSTRRFVMSLEDEMAIMTQLRNELSGLAFPQHVIDIPSAYGKVVVPSEHWNTDTATVTDFYGKTVNTHDWSTVIKQDSLENC
ncbi:KamA family radical SAM protein [Hafnia psychrotolerans]|uniref:Lysine 2,3-aminomutase n=1 Tax=Hafnia psychrotolerans TaxID=1477018 RepID=A0ABQ1G3A1_9GAMM|nr:radical SAM protein [Hafnia psychrotolerans]GGA35781.1 lysine 2,3-aminomutase [Hafnia psychrotolerans]